jgi:spoIIIJ-associated protein
MDPEEFLKGLFESYCKEVTITKTEEDNHVKYQVTGDNLNELIGYRGETLSSISYLTQVVAGRGSKKVVVDIENYREKRTQTLQELANRVASKVAKTGRYQKLEPMEPSERRIIHLALQDNDKVTTMSKGTEPNRYIIVFPREYKE